MTLKGLMYVIHRHLSRHPHFDLRLEVDGVLKSWAVPKEPSTDPKVKRLAVRVEDHALEYGEFEGFIPEGEYGAGEVQIWDQGTYENLQPQSMADCLRKGRVEVRLWGEKLQGPFALICLKGQEKNWLFFKMKA
ncbi:MAG: DNA polymerase ligase N-terminal domain-containing protein [Desulfobaccales bacterium]|nr:DNA polymerase ligase N-terminal domain-containing protein [Desulfobaccales bacterium]